MKKKLILPILMLMFFASSCGLTDKLSSQNNANITPKAVVPAPQVTVASTASTVSPTSSANNESLQNQKNLLAFASGTMFAQKPTEQRKGASAWSAIALIDESSTVGWASQKNGPTTQTIVFELPEKTLLKQLSFDTAKVEDIGSAAKNITIEVSDVSAIDGFNEILTTTLKDQTDDQVFDVNQGVPGRWVRLTIKDNYGNSEFTELMEIRGYGEQLTKSTLENISGTYRMTEFGNFHVKQDGTAIAGCYEYDKGRFDGGIDGRVIQLTWKEDDAVKSRDFGPAILVFSRDGKQLRGVWRYSDEKEGFHGVWNGEKISDEVGGCPHAPDLAKNNAAKTEISKDLNEKGRAAVYGINFDFNSDVIRAESKPTLDQIAVLLKENTDWKMTVEGHTDNVGGEAFNRTLSEKRAIAVVTSLVNNGIESNRLTSVGLGFSKPLAANDSEFGRAQNRRVELVKK